MESEERLPGGHITGAFRVGGTVRRPTGPWSPAVHLLLQHLESVRFEGAPRFLGIDQKQREVLEFVEGQVPAGLDPKVFGSEEVVFEVGRLISRFHEAVFPFRPRNGLTWRYRVGALNEGEIVCHGDLVPWNTVVRAGKQWRSSTGTWLGPTEPFAI